MKIGGPPGTHGNAMNYSQSNGGNKNVRIMLVGNNGNKSSQNAYKQNMNDMKGLQFSSQGNNGINPQNFPKTTKNGNTKFYS